MKIIVLLTIIGVQYLSNENLTFQNSNTAKALSHTLSNYSHFRNSRIASLAISLKLSNFGINKINKIISYL